MTGSKISRNKFTLELVEKLPSHYVEKRATSSSNVDQETKEEKDPKKYRPAPRKQKKYSIIKYNITTFSVCFITLNDKMLYKMLYNDKMLYKANSNNKVTCKKCNS